MASALVLLSNGKFKFSDKVLKRLYLLTHWMDLADNWPDVRCWSEIFHRLGDLEVKVIDFEILH